MRILIIHQNFPGQFRHLAKEWHRRPGWQVIGLGRDTAPGMADIPWYKYRLHRKPHVRQHPYLRTMENAVLHGQAVARAMLSLKAKGFVPDIIIAHPGWGETLYAKDVFPQACLISFCEWYYDASHPDLFFDAEFPSNFDDRTRTHTWNALHSLNLVDCDFAVSPTQWQRDRHPLPLRDKISVIHEGIDTDALNPDPQASVMLPSGMTLRAGDPVVTYVARNLEPYRGFHSFMRMLALLQKEQADFHTLIVGGDDVSYGQRPANAANWREALLQQTGLDLSRTHFTGKLPVNQYRRVLQISSVHVYLTYPFVLSWSMLEAMASGCLLVASRTPPVEEVIQHHTNGLLVDFFDYENIAATVLDTLNNHHNYQSVRDRARQDIQRHYTLQQGIAGYDRLLHQAGIL